LFAHPLFLDQLEKLTASVSAVRDKDPGGYMRHSQTKLLAMVHEAVFRRIPADPSDKRFRQGGTLGEHHKNWFRDKFANGRFRLFFRFDSRSKVIVYAWLNDDKTLRAYGSKSDAYAVFKKMLDSGNPPTDWKRLLQACTDPTVTTRAAEAFEKSK
jgi:toxin YhaV